MRRSPQHVARPRDGDACRSWRFISNRPCASCDGTRLRREARHVFVENTPLPTISDMSIGHAMDFFNNLKLSGQRAKIAEKC